MAEYTAKTAPARFNVGLPKAPLSTSWGSTCVGHQQTRSEDTSLDTFTYSSSYNVGERITSSTINTLRSKIRIELQKRYAHSTYQVPQVASEVAASAITFPTGSIASYNNHLRRTIDLMYSIGSSTSPSRSARRGAVPDPELTELGVDATKFTVYPSTNQLNLNTYPHPPAYSVTGMHSPPYTPEFDRKVPGSVVNILLSLSPGQIMRSSDFNTLVATYKSLSKDCICHSDCNCNAVCSCHNNCGCNY